jgi:transaldolase
MKAAQRLHDLGQNIWLDNVTRGFLTKGTLRHYITELSVTGLTSNPTIFDRAIKNTDFYNDAIRQKVRETIMNMECDREPHIFPLGPGWRRLRIEEIWQ